MPVVMIKGEGAHKLKRHLNEEHPELKHVVVLKKQPKRRRFKF